MPALSNTWMWEAPGSNLGHAQSSRLMASLPIALGTFVKLIPELSILGVPAAPRARELSAGEVRTNFSEGDVITHFAFGVQLGRFASKQR